MHYFLLCQSCNWIESLNPIEILISGAFGAFMGWLVTIIYTNRLEKNRIKNLKNKYKKLDGEYHNYFVKEKKITDRLLSKAIITYISEHELEIKVSTLLDDSNGNSLTPDEIQIWLGRITMDSTTSGVIVWSYQQPPRLIGDNGFKRIIVDSNLNAMTLVGEKEYGFGTERFIRYK